MMINVTKADQQFLIIDTFWRSLSFLLLLYFFFFDSCSRVVPPAGWDAGRHQRVPEVRQGRARHQPAVSAALPGRLSADQLVQVLVLHRRLRGRPHQEEGADRWVKEKKKRNSAVSSKRCRENRQWIKKKHKVVLIFIWMLLWRDESSSCAAPPRPLSPLYSPSGQSAPREER